MKKLWLCTLFIMLIGSVGAATCGNSYCEPPETIDSCYVDCTGSPTCGNMVCEAANNENKDNCPMDCGWMGPVNQTRTIGVMYYGRDEIYNLLKSEVAKHPDEASWEVIGQTILGKDILMFAFGNPNGGKFMFDGRGHGPEDCGTVMGYEFIKWVMNSNDTEAVRIRTNNYLLFIPVINGDTTKRQNMRRNYTLSNGTVLDVPYGVDLNRNFPTGWGGSGSGNMSDTYQYRGISGGSEPETQAVMNAMKKYSPQVYMNTHCGMFWLSSSSYSKAENTTKIKSLITQYDNKKNPLRMTTVGRYGNGTFGTGGYVGTEGAVHGGSGWIFELSVWDQCPPTRDQFVYKYWNITSVVYRAMANGVEVIQNDIIIPNNITNDTVQIDENTSIEPNITTLNDTAQNTTNSTVVNTTVIPYTSNLTNHFQNLYGIAWRGSACDNLAYAKEMGYEYVAYQEGMNKCTIANRTNMRFYVESPELMWASSVNPNNIYIYINKNFSQAQISLMESIYTWKANSTNLSFPDNMATGWWNSNISFRLMPDFQQEWIINASVDYAIKYAQRIENRSIGWEFGGWSYDTPETQGDYWSERQGGYTGLNWMCGTRLCNGGIVHLGYWNPPTKINTSGLHGNITHEYPDEQAAFTEVKTRIFNKTFELYPDAKLFYEPYGVWGYIKSIQNRPDVDKLFPQNRVLLSQENGDGLVNDLEIWTDSRIYASGLVNRSNTMVTTPDTYDQYRNLRISATAMINGGWVSHFGRFGGTDGTPNYQNISVVPFDHKLIRAIPNWENENNVPLSDRHWDNASKVYYSPITYASMDVEYSKHPKNGNIYGVFSSINGRIVLPENNTAVAIYKADGLFRKDSLAMDDFTINGNEIRLKSAANINIGYIIITGVFSNNNSVNITAPPVNVTPANNTPVINITIPTLEAKYTYKCATEVKYLNGYVFIKTKKMTKLQYRENYTEKIIPIIVTSICTGEVAKENVAKLYDFTIGKFI